jgi:DNA-binding NtrC family response regulator
LNALHSAEGRGRSKPRVLRILLLGNSLSDAELIRTRLSEGGMCYELACVQSRDAFDAALEKGDIVLAGYESPGFEGFSALELTKKVLPGAPFIFISGTPDEEAAIEALKCGATDYVSRNRLERFVPAVRRAVAGKPHRREEEAAQRDEEYRAMFEFAGVGHARIDLRTGRLLRVNPKLCRITGYSEAELLNMTFAELAHPKGRA